MAIRTQASLSGFIASDPQLSYTPKGEARFYARIGQEHYRRNDDGSFTELEPTFHNLVVYRTSAQRAHERFAKGDNFVAEGYVHPFEYERDGQPVKDEELRTHRRHRRGQAGCAHRCPHGVGSEHPPDGSRQTKPQRASRSSARVKAVLSTAQSRAETSPTSSTLDKPKRCASSTNGSR